MTSFFLQTYIRPKIDQSAARQSRSTAARQGRSGRRAEGPAEYRPCALPGRRFSRCRLSPDAAFAGYRFRRAPSLPPAASVAASAAALSSIWALCVYGRVGPCPVGIVPPSGRILRPSARHRGATIPVERGKDVWRSCKGEGSGGRACAHRAECLAAAPSCRPCNPSTYLGALGVAPAHPATSRFSCAHSLPFRLPGQGGGVAVSACAPRRAPCAACTSLLLRFAVAALRSHRVPAPPRASQPPRPVRLAVR